MKIIYSVLFFLVVCFFLYCCIGQTGRKELPVIDLDHPESTMNLKMSDIADNIRLIRLETPQEVLLPGYFKTCVGDKYLVTIGQEEIHLFTINGKYLRKVAQQGRGPEEFTSIWGYCLDESENRLYLADVTQIIVIDLKEGKWLQKLPVNKGSLRGILLTNDHSLAYISVIRSGEGQYEIGRINSDGTILESMHIPCKMGMAHRFYLEEVNDTVRYRISYEDTLYVLQDTVSVPYCRMVVSKPYSDVVGKGHFVDIAFENKDLFILADAEIEVKRKENMVASQTEYLGYYVYQKSEAKLQAIKDFYVDLLDNSYKNYFPLNVAGQKVYWNISIADFKRQLKDKLDSPVIADSLKTLYNELQDDDNPLVLVGDIK